MVDYALAAEMADLCRAAYAVAGSSAPYVSIIRRDGRRMIGLPGTHSIHEWLLDADYPQTDWNGGRVHRGFLSQYRRISFPEHKDQVEILIGGHSLGGPVAELLAFDLAGRGRKVQVFTFGAPRLGDPVFSSYYRASVPETWRVYNLRDTVPHLPPERIVDPLRLTVDRFEHVGQDVPLEFTGEGGGILGAAHAISNYRDALKLKIERKAA